MRNKICNPLSSKLGLGLMFVGLSPLLAACPANNGTTTEATDTDASTGDTTTDPTNDPTNKTTTDPTTGEPTTGTTTNETTSTTDATTTTDPTTDTDTTTGTQDNLCSRLGGAGDGGIKDLVTAFVVEGVLMDEKINGYFLNSDVDAGALGTCVINQLGALAECPGVTYDCKNMLDAHAGLGISQQDFDDFVVDFVAAYDEHAATHPDLTPDDKTTIGTALGGMAVDIVEDATNDATVYQRVGRKPAIKALIGMPGEAGSFVHNVALNDAINTFFANSMFDRLNTCLTRQVSGIDGPTKYGMEVTAPAPADPGVAMDNVCRDMKTTHLGLQDLMMGVITIEDFVALVTDLVTAMDTFAVPMAEQDAILAVLGPMCDDIVADPNTCPGNTKLDDLTEAVDLNLAIDNLGDKWDDKYNGKLDSMLCVTIPVVDTGLNFVQAVRLKVGMDHTFVGDITIKVVAPDNTLLTALGRPGPEVMPIPDNGVQCCGDDSNLLATFPFTLNNAAIANGKDMGKGLTNVQVICKDENPKIDPCQFKPYKGGGPGTDFNDFKGKAANGDWKVCFGDSGKGDYGKLQYIGLTLDRVKYAP